MAEKKERIGALHGANQFVFSPELASKIGLNEAIVLQQVHYWVEINKRDDKNKRDGFFWTYNSFKQWQGQFNFWGIATVVRTFRSLEELNLLIIGNYNKKAYDRTKWYRINNLLLEHLEAQPFNQNDKMDFINMIKSFNQNDKMDFINMIRPIPDTNQDINSDTTTDINDILGIFPENRKNLRITFKDFLSETNIQDYEAHVEVVDYYLKKYKQIKKKEHPKCTWQEWNNTIVEIFNSENVDDLKEEYEQDNSIMEEAIDRHFEKVFKTYKHDIRSFNKFRDNNLYEIGIL